MTNTGRTVLALLVSPIVLILTVWGTGIAAFSASEGAAFGAVLGLALLMSAGALLGMVLGPLPATSRRRSLMVAAMFLGIALIGLACAAAAPVVSAALRSGPLAAVFSPLAMALSLVIGVALLVARRPGHTVREAATPLRHTGSRDPPPG